MASSTRPRGPSSSLTGSGLARDPSADTQAETAAAAQRRVGWSELERIVAGEASPASQTPSTKTRPSQTPRAWNVGVVRASSETALDSLRGLFSNMTGSRVLIALGAVSACLLVVVLTVALTSDGPEDLKPSRARPALASPRGKTPALGRQHDLPPELPASDAAIPSRVAPRASAALPNVPAPKSAPGRAPGARSSDVDTH
jgi:hypothetical protein